MHKENINYEIDGETFTAYISYDNTNLLPRPLVLIAHDWKGRAEFACRKADEMAKQGYVGFALDMYGDAQLGQNNDECAALMMPLLEDRLILRRRMQTALQAARDHSVVDQQRIAVIGFCFGGLCALDLARDGADIQAVVSFHGNLTPAKNIANKVINAKILVLHGYADPMVPFEQVIAFQQEMNAAKVDWQVHSYGHNVMHAFTNPEANDPNFGTVYNEVAAHRAWQSMDNFLTEAFAS